jgi:hypothetical protein
MQPQPQVVAEGRGWSLRKTLPPPRCSSWSGHCSLETILTCVLLRSGKLVSKYFRVKRRNDVEVLEFYSSKQTLENKREMYSSKQVLSSKKEE